MSYILEALRKSERERQLGQAPSLPSLLADQTPRRQRWLPWLLALLLGVNGIALFYFWVSGSEKSRPLAQPAGAVHPQKPAESASAAEETKKPNIADVEKETSKRNRSLPEPTVAKIDAPPAISAEKQPTQEKPVEKIGSAASQSLPRESASLNKQTPVKKAVRARVPAESFEEVGGDTETTENISRPTDQEFSPIKESLSSGASSARTARTQEPDIDAEVSHEHDAIPLLSTMPPAFQQRIPAIKVNVLAYSSVPEERFAVIDMVRYSKGDRLPGGAVLVEIRSDSLVLELNGSRFRVPHR